MFATYGFLGELYQTHYISEGSLLAVFDQRI